MRKLSIFSIAIIFALGFCTFSWASDCELRTTKSELKEYEHLFKENREFKEYLTEASGEAVNAPIRYSFFEAAIYNITANIKNLRNVNVSVLGNEAGNQETLHFLSTLEIWKIFGNPLHSASFFGSDKLVTWLLDSGTLTADEQNNYKLTAHDLIERGSIRRKGIIVITSPVAARIKDQMSRP